MLSLQMDCSENNGRLRYDFKKGKSTFEIYLEATEPLSLNDSGFPLALFTTMSRGVEINYKEPCSQVLFENSKIISDYFQGWFPKFVSPKFTNPVLRSSSKGQKANRVGVFFTGGVDSFYTFLKNKDEITDLIFVHGFDVNLGNVDLRKKVSSALRVIADHYDKNLVEVETNLKKYLKGYLALHWDYSHGVALAVVLHALSNSLDKIYIASSHVFPDVVKWGSHPHIDPCWSSENIEVIHHGYESDRIDKIAFIAKCPFAIRRLRVCFKNYDNHYNCGDCEKCLRTLTAMRITGCIDQAVSFAGIYDIGKLRDLDRYDPNVKEFYDLYLRVLQENKDDPELLRVLCDLSEPSSTFERISHKIKSNRYAKKIKKAVKTFV